jgi:hypothetical protein
VVERVEVSPSVSEGMVEHSMPACADRGRSLFSSVLAATALRLVSGVRNLYPNPTAPLVPLYPKSPVREIGSGEVSPGLGDGVRLRLRRLPGQRVAAHAA